ncbi:MAG: PPC domain-containing protein [Theionarchaea archaeon]|nr:PPC domain-containing protein [Theionarchaea archaeon]
MKHSMKRSVSSSENSLLRSIFIVTIIIAVSLQLIYIPQPVSAQSDYGHYGGVIPLNRLIGGTITGETDFIEYTFSGQEGQHIFITLQAAGYGKLNPYLKLRGPDGSTLDTDNDGWFDRNSKIEIILPQDGAYTVTATRYREHDGQSTGNFLLWVTESHPCVAYYGVLSPNQCIIGAISDECYGVEHTFSGKSGEEVTITMKKFKSNLDTLLKLRGPDGSTLDIDNNGGSGRNSKIEISLPQNGEYTIHATRSGTYNGKTSGQYILCLKSNVYPTGGVLHTNQIIMGYIGENLNSITYSFEYTGDLNRGVNVTVRTQFSNQYPRLNLYNSSNNYLDTLSFASSQSAELACTHVPHIGIYYVRLAVSQKGYYTITLRHPAYAR